MHGWLSVLALLVSSACAPDMTEPSRAALGRWGGEHVSLVVGASGGTVEFDCAHGTLSEPLVTNRAGRFAVSGVFVREHGGPIRVDEVPDARPARYSGIVDGQKMVLIVAIVDENQTLGPFTLGLNAPPRLVKCL